MSEPLGDSADFMQRVEFHRKELQVHCYRMLGSLSEAEEATQDTLTRAWLRRDSFRGIGTLRAWLYKIATNICLDALRKHSRRWLPPQVESNIDNTPWLEPYPDEQLPDPRGGPEEAQQQRETVHLAFMVALHQLAPRQRAVLLLTDVLEWSVGEISIMLQMTAGAVNSALHRARVRMADYRGRTPPQHGAETPSDLHAQLRQYIEAWERADVDALVSLLRAEAILSMPPDRKWLNGRTEIITFLRTSVLGVGTNNHWRMLPTHANGCAAMGFYLFDAASGMYRAFGIQVLHFENGLIGEITAFCTSALLARFGLPEHVCG